MMREKVAEADGEGGADGDGWSVKVDGDGGCSSDPTMGRDDVERLRQMQLSVVASSSMFPGFRFSPTDDELINYYLRKKLQGSDDCVDIIPEVDFCRHEPWDLPALSIIPSDNEWFFFSTRGKKYPNGSQSKRATQSGYWKATGKERNVKSGSSTIGTKRTLVFHNGRAPKGERTEWIMHEYCMSDTTQEALVVCRLRRNGDFRLNEPSRGSTDHRNLSAPDNSHSGTNENVNTQMDGFDHDANDVITQMDGFDHDANDVNTQMDGFDHDANAIKSCSKESTSSYKSHSLEQNESGSDSDRQVTLESLHGSSSPHKDCVEEDDCFADIINDDIVKLDESASHSLTFQGVFTGDLPLFVRDPTKCMQKLPQETMSSHALTGQGTAVRRIRLRQHKGQTQHNKPPRYVSRNNDADQTDKKKSSSGCVVSFITGYANRVKALHPSHLIMVFMFLLILFVVAWKGGLDLQHPGTSLEVFKRQLKHWLHKAADRF